MALRGQIPCRDRRRVLLILPGSIRVGRDRGLSPVRGGTIAATQTTARVIAPSRRGSTCRFIAGGFVCGCGLPLCFGPCGLALRLGLATAALILGSGSGRRRCCCPATLVFGFGGKQRAFTLLTQTMLAFLGLGRGLLLRLGNSLLLGFTLTAGRLGLLAHFTLT